MWFVMMGVVGCGGWVGVVGCDELSGVVSYV